MLILDIDGRCLMKSAFIQTFHLIFFPTSSRVFNGTCILLLNAPTTLRDEKSGDSITVSNNALGNETIRNSWSSDFRSARATVRRKP